MGRRVGTALVCSVAALAAGPGAAAVAPGAPVACPDASYARVHGARVLLDAVVLPRSSELALPARAGQDGHYRWFRPARIAIRSGEPDVAVSVPLGWRETVAVAWGRSSPGDVVRFGSCAAARGWVVYEGGFHLRDRAACVPVVIRVGGTSTTVRLGLGRACGGGTR
jgi:hypothetical protein